MQLFVYQKYHCWVEWLLESWEIFFILIVYYPYDRRRMNTKQSDKRCRFDFRLYDIPELFMIFFIQKYLVRFIKSKLVYILRSYVVCGHIILGLFVNIVQEYCRSFKIFKIIYATNDSLSWSSCYGDWAAKICEKESVKKCTFNIFLGNSLYVFKSANSSHQLYKRSKLKK